MSIKLDPTSPLTPSELILLNAKQFTGKSRANTEDLLNGKTRGLSRMLGGFILTSAILANEKLGAIQLEVKIEKQLFIFSTTKLFVVSNNSNVIWPSNTLESFILSASINPTEVHEIIYYWLRNDSYRPMKDVIRRIRDGMLQRHLLNAVGKKTLKFFTTVHYDLPLSTINLSSKQNIESIQQLLLECYETRQEIWRLLERQVYKGVYRREIDTE